MFKQTVPSAGLAIEQGTEQVPDDGAYHVVLRRKIVFSSRSRAKALGEYKRLKDALTQGMTSRRSASAAREALRRERAEMEAAGMLAASGRRKRIKATAKGGRGGRGGI